MKTAEVDDELTTQLTDRLIGLRLIIEVACGGTVSCSATTSPCSSSPFPYCATSLSPTAPQACTPYRYQSNEFLVNECSGTVCTDRETYDVLQSRVDYANEAFKPAGVQFYIKSIERHNNFFLGNAQWPQSVPVRWDAVKGAFSEIFLVDCNAWADDHEETQRDWMRLVTTYYADPSEITMFLPVVGSASGTGDYPSEGKSINMPRGIVTQYKGNFAHELGHYFGLPHSFKNSNTCSQEPSTRPDPCSNTAAELTTWTKSLIDPATDPPLPAISRPGSGQTIPTSSYYWDLIYGTTPTGGPYTFNTEQGALDWLQSAEGGNLFNKNILYFPAGGDLDPLGTNTNCGYQSGSGRTSITCLINGTYYNSPANVLQGLDFIGTSGNRTSNLMTYNVGIWDADPINMLSRSQIRHIRRALRYNIHNRATDLSAHQPSGGAYVGQVGWGDRPQLGRTINRAMASEADFDGDNKRDLVVWNAPASPGELGSFTVWLARHFAGSPTNYTTYTYPMGHGGDTPLVMDMNGDGVSDLVVVTKANRDDPFDKDVKWMVRYCSWVYSPLFGYYYLSCPNGGSTTEPGTEVSHLGLTSDIFLSSFDYDGNAATTEIAIFRPSTSRYYWCTPGVNCESAPLSKQVGPTGGKSVVALPGLYDDDEITDLVVYSVMEGKFYVQRSGGGGSTYSGAQVVHNWGQVPHVPRNNTTPSVLSRAGSIPLVNLWKRNTYNQWRTAIGLWHPEAQEAFINWSPITSTALPPSCLIGSSEDVPLPGGIDLAGDGRTDVLWMVPNQGTNATGNLRFTAIGTSCSGMTSSTKLSNLVSNNTMVYVTADWSGDGLPDIVTIDRATMVWTGYLSPNYTTQLNLGAFGSNRSSPL